VIKTTVENDILDKYLEQKHLTKPELNQLLKQQSKLAKQGYSISDITNIVKSFQQKPTKTQRYQLGKYDVKFILTSDNHMGNIAYDSGLNTLLANTAKDRDVDFIANGGDILDGWYQNRPQALFEQNAFGLDQQMDLAERELSKYEKPFYFITGNHTFNTYMRGAGIEIGPYLEERLGKNMDTKFLGNAEGDIELGNKSTIKLLHPDGGTAYALSYRPQKIAESFTGGEKPSILSIGHFHKAEYIFYRNIHILQSGTLCGQTKFMCGKNIPAMKGFWYIEAHGKKTKPEIDRISMEWFPSYK